MKLRHLFLILPLLLVGTSCNRDPKIVSRKYVENANKYFNAPASLRKPPSCTGMR